MPPPLSAIFPYSLSISLSLYLSYLSLLSLSSTLALSLSLSLLCPLSLLSLFLPLSLSQLSFPTLSLSLCYLSTLSLSLSLCYVPPSAIFPYSLSLCYLSPLSLSLSLSLCYLSLHSLSLSLSLFSHSISNALSVCTPSQSLPHESSSKMTFYVCCVCVGNQSVRLLLFDWRLAVSLARVNCKQSSLKYTDKKTAESGGDLSKFRSHSRSRPQSSVP